MKMDNISINASLEIFQRLNVATSYWHSRVEERMPVFRPDFDLAGYVRLLEHFYGFWNPLEARLLLVKPLMHPLLALPARMKTQLLQADLRALGYATAELPQCPELPFIGTFPSALGCLYVLEGSTLGARIISRRIASHLNLLEHSGAAFFNAYGDSTGRRWSEFRLFVTANVSVEESTEVVNAAVQTFQRFFA